MSRICLAAGTPELAEPFLAGADAPAARYQHCRSTAGAVMAEARGDLDTAAGRYDQARTGWRRFGVVLEHAQALLGLGRCATVEASARAPRYGPALFASPRPDCSPRPPLAAHRSASLVARPVGWCLHRGEGARVRYEIVAQAYRDLEAASARLELIGRLADLVRQTPDDLLPSVALLCQGQIAPDFAGVELGLAERMAARAVAQVAGVPAEQVLAAARDSGDLGLAAERLLADLEPDRPATLEVEAVFEGLHQVAEAQGAGSLARNWPGWSPAGAGHPAGATWSHVTGTYAGIAPPNIDAMAEVHAAAQQRPILDGPTTSAPTEAGRGPPSPGLTSRAAGPAATRSADVDRG